MPHNTAMRLLARSRCPPCSLESGRLPSQCTVVRAEPSGGDRGHPRGYQVLRKAFQVAGATNASESGCGADRCSVGDFISRSDDEA
jgi:hypothetical protein